MELIASLLAIILITLISGFVILQTLNSSKEGWRNAEHAHRQVEDILLSRVNSVENRLMSHSWEEFANLQQVPDELGKVSYAQGQRSAESYGVMRRELLEDEVRHDGADLEGDVFDGPTIG